MRKRTEVPNSTRHRPTRRTTCVGSETRTGCAVTERQTVVVVVVENLVDALPERLWAPGNLYMLPGGDWHFCSRSVPSGEHAIRTVEWRGREIAHGHRAVIHATGRDDDIDMGE